MSDRAVFDVDLGDRGAFMQQAIDWCAFWRPDQSAIVAMQRAPPTVLCVVLGRPSGWSEVQSISKAVSTSLKRALAVYRGSYDRDEEQEDWVNSRPFDRSGNILFKYQS
eukprot:1466872-Alexandrium_andersonii.AAC.1